MLITIDKVVYKYHRIVWLWVTGKWPRGNIDHIDKDAMNNRWSNLRDVTHKENMSNKDPYRPVSSVRFSKGHRKWYVTLICANKEQALAIYDLYALRSVAP